MTSALRLGVERAGRLVEQQDRRAVVDGARDRDPLRLAAREPQAALADPRVVAEREALDELVRVRELRRPDDARLLGLVAEGDVAADRVVEQVALLEHEADVPAERAVVERASGRSRRSSIVPSVGSSRPARHLTSVVLPEPLRPTIATVCPGGDVEVDPLEDRRRLRAAVAEADVAELGRAPSSVVTVRSRERSSPCSGSCSITSFSRSSRIRPYCSSSQSESIERNFSQSPSSFGRLRKALRSGSNSSENSRTKKTDRTFPSGMATCSPSGVNKSMGSVWPRRTGFRYPRRASCP